MRTYVVEQKPNVRCIDVWTWVTFIMHPMPSRGSIKTTLYTNKKFQTKFKY